MGKRKFIVFHIEDEGDEHVAKECLKYSKAKAMVVGIKGEACGTIAIMVR